MIIPALGPGGRTSVQVGVKETEVAENREAAYTHTGRTPVISSGSQFVGNEDDPVCAANVISVGSGGVRRLQRSPGPVRRHPH